MAIMTVDPVRTRSTWLFPAALVAASAVAAWQASAFSALAFKPFRAEEIVGNLTSLFLISLFLERALEVFVSWWRDVERVKLEQEIARLETDASADAQRRAVELKQQLQLYKSQTARRTFMCGLAAGAVIALAGARALSPLLADLPAAGSPQALMVVIADVVITAGLIGGGSDGIHKLVSVITDYLEKVRANVANK